MAERAGLVSTHAYAVLDVRLVEGEKLFKLKNPWSHLRWRGNWSELDTKNWTPHFRHKLDYVGRSVLGFINSLNISGSRGCCKFRQWSFLDRLQVAATLLYVEL